jgi:hypothetical protein
MIKAKGWLVGLIGFTLVLSNCTPSLEKQREEALEEIKKECREEWPFYGEHMSAYLEEWENLLGIKETDPGWIIRQSPRDVFLSSSTSLEELQSVRQKVSELNPPWVIEKNHHSFLRDMDQDIDSFIKLKSGYCDTLKFERALCVDDPIPWYYGDFPSFYMRTQISLSGTQSLCDFNCNQHAWPAEDPTVCPWPTGLSNSNSIRPGF